MSELTQLTCILGLRYATRGPALDPAYGEDGVELCLDVLGPAPLPDEPLPTVVRIDGCPGWMPGHRNAGIGPFANPLLAHAGFLTISVSVRHSRQAAFPAQLQDIDDAVEWLRINSPGLPIDRDRMGIWGQSAGGHIAALHALTQRTVKAAVVICAPTDLLTAGGEMVNDAPSPITDLVGGTDREQLRRASPITYVTPAAPPFLIIHGTRDETVPFDQAERLDQALRKAGAESRLLPIEGGYHNLRADPRPTDDGPVPHRAGDAVRDFFDRYLRS